MYSTTESSPEVIKLQEILNHWQMEYKGNDWKGTEQLYFWIGTIYDRASIDNFGLSGGIKMILPHTGKDKKAIIVEIDRVHHEGGYIISPVAYSTNDIDLDSLKWTGHKDHARRIISWLYAEAKALSKLDINFSREMLIMRRQVKAIDILTDMIDKIIPKLGASYEEIFGKEIDLPTFSISVNKWLLREGSVGSIKSPSEILPWAFITIDANAFKKGGVKYAYYVLLHELIHAAIGNEGKSHSPEFKKLADAMNLPKEHWD